MAHSGSTTPKGATSEGGVRKRANPNPDGIYCGAFVRTSRDGEYPNKDFAPTVKSRLSKRSK